MIAIKSFLHLSGPCPNHPTRKGHPWYQVYSSEISNENVDHYAHVINQQCWPVDKKTKKRWWKNVGLFLQNMKPWISYNGHNNILNDIMGWSPLLTKGVIEEVDPYGV
jgi:hypothetical protein